MVHTNIYTYTYILTWDLLTYLLETYQPTYVMHTNQLIFDIIKYLLGTFKQTYFGLTSIRTWEVGTYINILSWDHTWDIITDLLGSYNQFIWDILLYLLEKRIKYWLGHTKNNVHTKDMLTYLLQALTTLLGHAKILTTGTNHIVGTCKHTYYRH